MRTRHLIEVGGLVTKAGLDYLPTNTLYGALLSIASSLETNQAIKDEWTKIGKTKLDQEQTNKHAVILKFEQEPNSEIRAIVRTHGLKWNNLTHANGTVYFSNIDSLKNDLGTIQYQIEEL
jgi:hypothetical protein